MSITSSITEKILSVHITIFTSFTILFYLQRTRYVSSRS